VIRGLRVRVPKDGGGASGNQPRSHLPCQTRRRGANKAAVAVANSLLFTIWHLLSTGALYQDPGADYFERRHDPVVEAKRLARRIEALGFDVSLIEKAGRPAPPAGAGPVLRQFVRLIRRLELA
jgi:hypothetical protein